MKIEMGIGWVQDGPGRVRSATPSEYVAEIERQQLCVRHLIPGYEEYIAWGERDQVRGTQACRDTLANVKHFSGLNKIEDTMLKPTDGEVVRIVLAIEEEIKKPALGTRGIGILAKEAARIIRLCRPDLAFTDHG